MAIELRQRRPRQTANPIVSNKPDVEHTFNSSKLGVRVRPNDRKIGLWVAAITEEAPQYVQQHVDAGSQIISVNGTDILNMPFQQAVEHFAQLNLPVTVRFRPPLYPASNNNNNNNDHHGGHGHHHHHHNHNHHSHGGEDDDDEQDGTCFIACYIILFVLSFMFLVSVSLNGLPSLPRSLPSFSLFRRNKGAYRRNGPKYMYTNDETQNQNANSNSNSNQKMKNSKKQKVPEQPWSPPGGRENLKDAMNKKLKDKKQAGSQQTLKTASKTKKKEGKKRLLLSSYLENENENENRNENENDWNMNEMLDEIDRLNRNDFERNV